MNIFYAARNGNLNRVKQFLNKGVNVNAQTPVRRRALHYAAESGHLPVVKELLNRGANIHARDRYGRQPIHNAAFYGHLNILKELINRGANIHARDNRGNQPINLAVIQGRLLPVVKELIRRGVNPSNIKKRHMSPEVANYLRLLSVRPAVEKFKQLRAKAHTRNRAPSIVLAEHPLSPFNPNTIKRRAKKYEMSFGQYVKDLGFTNFLYR